MIWPAKAILMKSSIDEGIPTPDNFYFEQSAVSDEELSEGDAIVQLLSISADPYLRTAMRTGGFLKPGQPLNGFVAGKIIASRNEDWSVGDLIGSNLPFVTVQVIPKMKLVPSLSRKLNGFIDESQISIGIGLLGMPGATAYGGVIDVLRPKQGETIFISAAAGAVGGLVGMIAKNVFNCKVIGSAGGPEKCDVLLNFYGFDHAIDYKTINTTEELTDRIKELAPDGIDMYFENVGGMHLDASMKLLRIYGRVCVCGVIAEYTKDRPAVSYYSPLDVIYKRLRIEGVLSADYLNGSKLNFLKDMDKWYKEGKVKPLECFFDSIEMWPEAFASLFTGQNVGKVVVRV